MGQKIEMHVNKNKDIKLEINRSGSSGGTGTHNYNALINKPRINGVILEGDKLDTQLNLQHIMDEITEQDIDNIIFGGNL